MTDRLIETNNSSCIIIANWKQIISISNYREIVKVRYMLVLSIVCRDDSGFCNSHF